jgi:hypothetical protein
MAEEQTRTNQEKDGVFLVVSAVVAAYFHTSYRKVHNMPMPIVLDEGTDKNHVLRIGMSMEPMVIAK